MNSKAWLVGNCCLSIDMRQSVLQTVLIADRNIYLVFLHFVISKKSWFGLFDWNYNVYQNSISCSSWYLLCPHSCLLFICLYCIVQFCFSSLVIICFNNLHFFFNYNFQPNLFLAHGKKDFYSLQRPQVVSRLQYFGPILFVILCVLILLKYISFIHTCQLSTGNDVSGCYCRHYFPFFLSQDLFKQKLIF